MKICSAVYLRFQLPLSGSRRSTRLIQSSADFSTFNSLSRDHKTTSIRYIGLRLTFQLPLSGSLRRSIHKCHT